MQYFEDIPVGQTHTFGSYTVTRAEVLEFAGKYDPQAFHLDDDAAGDDQSDPSVNELRFSTTEILRNKDFATYTSDELTRAHELMSHLRLIGAPRNSLRKGPTRRITSRPDSRRTVRSAIRAGGEPIGGRNGRDRCPRDRRGRSGDEQGVGERVGERGGREGVFELAAGAGDVVVEGGIAARAGEVVNRTGRM